MIPPFETSQKTLPRLSNAQVAKIVSLKGVFADAQNLTGVPWQAVAAIWTRESFSVAPPRTPGGPFQFDPVPPANALRKLVEQYTPLSGDKAVELCVNGVNHFPTAAVFAACWLRTKTKAVITPEVDDETILDAIWGYNGKVQADAWHSPYVVNGYDLQHYPLILRGTIPDKGSPGGRKHVEFADHRPGAFTVYKQLKGLKV